MKIADVYLNDTFLVRMMLYTSGMSILEQSFKATVISTIQSGNVMVVNLVSNFESGIVT